MDRQVKKKPWLRRNIGYVVLGTIILSFVVYQIAFADHGSRLNVKKDEITIGEVKLDSFLDYIAVIGTVQPIKTVYLDATEGGRVEDKLIEEGSMVKKGDVIMRLSNDNLVLEISNNEAQVARAINDLKTMRLNLENQNIDNKNQLVDLHFDLLKQGREYNYNKELYKNGHISKEEFEVSKEQYERDEAHYTLLEQKNKQDSIFTLERVNASEASVNRMQHNLDLIRRRLDNLTVRAPVDGELATLNPEVGEVISYGTHIGTINILSSYKLKVEIDEHYISRVQRGLKGECDFSGTMYPAEIKKIYPEVTDGKFVVDMIFTGDVPKAIRIGQTSRIRLELGEPERALLIPRGGFYQTTGGQWIFVVDKSGKFAYKRNIRIGRQNPNYYEVLGGLKPGEQVIVSSYDNFGDVDKLVLK